jgi:hypothetical protein
MSTLNTPLQSFPSTITITYGDQAENHVGMQKIGTMAQNGLELKELMNAKEAFEKLGCVVELVHLNDYLPAGVDEADDAYILVARGAVQKLTGDANAVYDEQNRLNHDKKAYMYGRVVNKKARYNLCFDEVGQDPDYENGKGRIVSWKDIPLTSSIRKALPTFFGPKTQNLTAEGNYYYDVTKCGIGFHGDAERKMVIAMRLGTPLPLHYHWYKGSQRVGRRAAFTIHHGDMYAMSEKATGYDWKRKSIYTLRHAAGCNRFTK